MHDQAIAPWVIAAYARCQRSTACAP